MLPGMMSRPVLSLCGPRLATKRSIFATGPSHVAPASLESHDPGMGVVVDAEIEFLLRIVPPLEMGANSLLVVVVIAVVGRQLAVVIVDAHARHNGLADAARLRPHQRRRLRPGLTEVLRYSEYHVLAGRILVDSAVRP